MIIKTIVQEKKIVLALFAYVFILLFFCSKMSPLYPINEWSDINLYFNIGKMLPEGKVLYTEVFDHKGPLIFVIYSIGSVISPTSFLGMYFIQSIAWAIMILFAYLTARLFVNQMYSFFIALLFSSFMLTHNASGGSAEEFIAIAQVVSLYFFILYFKDKGNTNHKPTYMIVHGLMSAVALLIKINLVIFWFFPLLAIFIILLKNKEYKNFIQNAIAYIVGVLILLAPICIYFIVNNAFGEFWNTYIILNKSYAGIPSISESVQSFIHRFYLRLRFDTYIFAIILIGAIYFPFKFIGNKWGKASIMLSFLTLYIAIFISPRFVQYYSIPLDIYLLLGFISFSQVIKIKTSKKMYILLFTVALIVGVKEKSFFGSSFSDLIRGEVSSSNKESEGLIFEFADIIKKEENPTLLNLGLDKGNAVFTITGIKPTVKYFISPNLPFDIYPQMRIEQTEYIKNRETQFIILMSNSFNFDYFRNLPDFTDNYAPVSAITDDERKTYYLYKRKD